METNEAVITVITLAIILGIIGAFAVLITIKYKYDIKPDDLKINSIIFEDRDSYLNFLNNFIKHVNTTRRNNSKEDIVIY